MSVMQVLVLQGDGGYSNLTQTYFTNATCMKVGANLIARGSLINFT